MIPCAEPGFTVSCPDTTAKASFRLWRKSCATDRCSALGGALWRGGAGVGDLPSAYRRDDHDADREPVRGPGRCRRQPAAVHRVGHRLRPGLERLHRAVRRDSADRQWAGTRRPTATSARRPAPALADASGNVTFPAADPNHAFHPFKGASPQGLFNCLAPTRPSPANGLPDFTNCQFRVSTNNSAGTSDQVFLTMTLPAASAGTAPGLHGHAGCRDGRGGVQLRVHRDHRFAGADVLDEPGDDRGWDHDQRRRCALGDADDGGFVPDHRHRDQRRRAGRGEAFTLVSRRRTPTWRRTSRAPRLAARSERRTASRSPGSPVRRRRRSR